MVPNSALACLAPGVTLLVLALPSAPVPGQGDGSDEASVYPAMPPGRPPLVSLPDAEAATAQDMKRYTEGIVGTGVTFDLTPIPGGRFLLGSPETESDRKASEGPQVEVAIAPFWMGVHEVTWDEFQLYSLSIDVERRKAEKREPAPQDAWADAVSRPTPPYVPMDFEMGVNGFPAICMTQLAAKQYTKWLYMKTGRFYRLPTEAEWEYACRAGTTTAYSFGDDPDDLDEHGWYFDNAEDTYQPVGRKKPNPWGLHDMHGNVAEWVLDRYDRKGYAALEAGTANPVNWPIVRYPRVVRGGSWDDDPDALRSAARRASKKGWKVQDPQLPKSIWYHTEANFVGFRVVRPLVEPTDAEKRRYWEPDLESDREILERQRRGGR